MRQQQRHGIGLIESGQVEEITVLPEGPLAVGVMGGQRCGGNHGRRRTQLLEEALPPAGVDGGVEVVHASVGLR